MSPTRSVRACSHARAFHRTPLAAGPALAKEATVAAEDIEKCPTGDLVDSLNVSVLVPQHGGGDGSQRMGVQLSWLLNESLSSRPYGNLNRDFAGGTTPPANGEGVKNKDINVLLRWDVIADQVLELETGFMRQDNIYADDRINSNGTGAATYNEPGRAYWASMNVGF